MALVPDTRWRVIDPACVGGSDNTVATIRGVICLLTNIIRPFPAIIALASLSMIIFAGIRLINAGANEKEFAAGMQTLLFAVIGIILLVVIWLGLITIENLTGASVTNFGFN